MKLTDPALIQKGRNFCNKPENLAELFKEIVDLCDKYSKKTLSDTNFINKILAFRKFVITLEEKKSAAGRKVNIILFFILAFQKKEKIVYDKEQGAATLNFYNQTNIIGELKEITCFTLEKKIL
jgi:hypothetical protein